MKEKIIELVKQGKTYKEIKKELGCALSTIAYHCKKEDIINENMIKKIDSDTIHKINELYQSGLTSIQVSKELGIAKSTVLKYIENVRKKKVVR